MVEVVFLILLLPIMLNTLAFFVCCFFSFKALSLSYKHLSNSYVVVVDMAIGSNCTGGCYGAGWDADTARLK